MNASLRLASVLAFGAAALAAHAGSYTFSGLLTATSPTFNRPLAGNPPTGLSGVGTNVFYGVLPFTVDLTGTYTLKGGATYTSSPSNDGFGVLYAGTFNPASPLTNALVADDDGAQTGVGNYLITRTLTAGTTYRLVTTTFNNGVTGTFADVISGPGNIVVGPVPEPSALAALGLGAAALLRRRKRA